MKLNNHKERWVSTHLENCLKRFTLFESTIIDGVWYSDIDHFRENDTVFASFVQLPVSLGIDGDESQLLTVIIASEVFVNPAREGTFLGVRNRVFTAHFRVNFLSNIKKEMRNAS